MYTTQFLEVSMNIDPAEKEIKNGRIEKYILRKAFDTTDEPDIKPYLPAEILWRQKEQFSDGVGYGWIDILKVLPFIGTLFIMDTNMNTGYRREDGYGRAT
jgi:asparagine synthetase B (glutamine-hydrolysing)